MTDLYLQSDGRDMTVWHGDKALQTEQQTDEALWAHLKATLPTRDEPQDEPTDPAVRVRDVVQGEWARVGQRWVSESGGILQWEALCEVYGPLEVIQPDAPSADERPFKVGAGDDDDVEAGRCCPNCRTSLATHNKSVWNAGYAVARRHFSTDAPC